MTNVISLGEVTKEEKIKKLEEELKEYRLQEKVKELKEEISDRIAALTVTYVQAMYQEDMDAIVSDLEDLLEKLEPFKDNDKND
jgi:N-acetyl-anhydromuramyl-L-alanine amidase AmpD